MATKSKPATRTFVGLDEIILDGVLYEIAQRHTYPLNGIEARIAETRKWKSKHTWKGACDALTAMLNDTDKRPRIAELYEPNGNPIKAKYKVALTPQTNPMAIYAYYCFIDDDKVVLLNLLRVDETKP